MPAPEYQRKPDLQPATLGELKGGLGFAGVFDTLAEKLRDYTKGSAPNQNRGANNSAGQPGHFTPEQVTRILQVVLSRRARDSSASFGPRGPQ